MNQVSLESMSDKLNLNDIHTSNITSYKSKGTPQCVQSDDKEIVLTPENGYNTTFQSASALLEMKGDLVALDLNAEENATEVETRLPTEENNRGRYVVS